MINHLKEYKDLFLPGAIILASLILGGSLVYSGGVNINTSGGTTVRSTTRTTSDTTLSRVDNNGSTVTFIIGVDDHIRGNPNAKVTLVEFSDFECPFCSRFHPTMLQALEEYGDQVRWVYKHFPLDAIHPQARPAAEASECVWEQRGDEGFWEFADAMFENQSRLGNAFYEEVAQQIGVDLSQFQTCVAERKYQDKVEQDYRQGLQAGVTGTPGSFVNGTPVKGAVPYEQLKAIIEDAL